MEAESTGRIVDAELRDLTWVRNAGRLYQAGGDVVKAASGASRTGGFALGLMFATAVIELFAVAFASAGFEEVAAASPFGHPGTAIVAVLIAVVALAGVLVAMRDGTGTLRLITAIAVFSAAGVAALMAFFFVIAGGTPIILAVLLAHVAISVGMIGRAVLQPAPSRSGR